jgi:uncharacterized phage-associated protein
MKNQNIDKAKVKAVILYIVSKAGTIDLHKLFKILYFAERDHLVMYGRKIVEDNYLAMTDGPVPSYIYDIFKKNPKCLSDEDIEFFEKLHKQGYFVSSTELPDMDELSKSDIGCIDKSFEENFHLTKDQLTRKSHDIAYNNAVDRISGCKNSPMFTNEIAKEGGASPEMIEYINDISFIRSCI